MSRVLIGMGNAVAHPTKRSTKRNHVVNNKLHTVALIVLSFWASISSAAFSDRTIEFSEYNCRLTLTDPNLEWLEHSHVPQALAMFGDPHGNVVIFMVTHVPEAFVFDDSFAEGFDESFNQPGVLSKIDGAITTFRGAPCYLLRARMLQEDLYVTNRSFYANDVIYGVQLISSELPEGESGKLNSYFSCFEFIGNPDIRQSHFSASERQAYNTGRLLGQITGYCVLGILVISLWKVCFGRKRRGA